MTVNLQNIFKKSIEISISLGNQNFFLPHVFKTSFGIPVHSKPLVMVRGRSFAYIEKAENFRVENHRLMLIVFIGHILS